MTISSLSLFAGLLFTTSERTTPMADTSLPKVPFQVTGSIPGMADGTKLYLRVMNPFNLTLDSAEVKNGQFSMKGQFQHPGYQAIVQPVKLTDYVTFWLEESPVTITGKEGKLRGSVVTGGPMQTSSRNFSAQIAPIRKASDAIDEKIEETKNEERKRWIDSAHAIRKREMEFTQQFISQNASNAYSAYLLKLYSTTWGKAVVSKLYQQLSASMKASSYGKEIDRYLTLSREINVGDPFVNFTQNSPEGKPISLNSYKDKVVLLEFWASWCGPCREENPILRKTYATFKEKGFEIHAVSLDDDKNAWIAAIKSDQLTWPQVSDLKGDRNEGALIYNINGIPDNLLIGKDGKVIARNLRGDELYKKLAEVLK